MNALGDVLQRLELKHTSQLDDLRILIHNAAVRLENSENAGVNLPAEALSLAQEERVKRVYVVEPAPEPHVPMETESPVPVKLWKPFFAGMLSMLVLSGTTVLGWQIMHKPEPAQMQFAATLAPLPAVLSDEQIRLFRQSTPSPDTGIKQTEQQLTRLVQLKPDWAISYGDELLKQALMLWPEQAKPLVQQWQQQIAITTLPEDSLYGWHQGMTQLEQLAKRLNALDEQKGKYMTVSELKSAVFAMSQSFNSAVPVEEQLRQLSVLTRNQSWPAALQSQTEQHLQQLITRYAALKHKTVE